MHTPRAELEPLVSQFCEASVVGNLQELKAVLSHPLVAYDPEQLEDGKDDEIDSELSYDADAQVQG